MYDISSMYPHLISPELVEQMYIKSMLEKLESITDSQKQNEENENVY